MRKHCEKFDVIYDTETGKYLEHGCNDPDCEYCAKRPENLKEACKGCHHELPGGSICKGLKDV
jgi:hypothetical protein